MEPFRQKLLEAGYFPKKPTHASHDAREEESSDDPVPGAVPAEQDVAFFKHQLGAKLVLIIIPVATTPPVLGMLVVAVAVAVAVGPLSRGAASLAVGALRGARAAPLGLL